MQEQKLWKELPAGVLEFFCQLLDNENPAKLIAEQPDESVRRMLEELWLQHQEAEKRQFLDEGIAIVRDPNSAAEVFAPGAILNKRFTIHRLVGRGGMGEVYFAVDKLCEQNVALKTMTRHLAQDEKSRVQFREEVQNSRRVTHKNVCRIFDIHEDEDSGLPFLSMTYVPGSTLSEMLAAGPLNPKRARALAIQIAEGLAAAHKEGILHCDLKPSNIIIQGSGKDERAVITDFGLARVLGCTDPMAHGTLEYMAPELKERQPASVSTDIYAFGKVLEAILPKHRLVAACTAEDAERRPKSMDAVREELVGGPSRRQILLGGMGSGLAVAGTGAYFLQRIHPPLLLGSQQRLKVNGFTAETPEMALTVRGLFIMALRQSPLLSVVGDPAKLSPSKDNPLDAGFALPIKELLSAARDQNIPLAIDGTVKNTNNGVHLTIHVYQNSDPTPRYTGRLKVDDPRRLVALAEDAAKDLRLNAFGEPELHSSYMPLEQVTSGSPAALDCYFRAVALYEKDQNQDALILLDRAIALDPEFVLGHHYRALILLAEDELERALSSQTIAFAKRRRVTERERNWIEGQYANLVLAFDESAEALRNNTVLYPDEAIFHRQYAFALMRQGYYHEAIPHNQTAATLDPFSRANTSELVVNLAEVGRYNDSFAQAKKLQEQDPLHNHVHRGLGLAYLQAGKYEEALSEFRQFGQLDWQLESESRLHSVGPLVMLGRFPEAILWMESDLAGPAAHDEHTYRRRKLLGQVYRLQGDSNSAAVQAERLIEAPALPVNLIHLREACALAFDLKEPAIVQRSLDRLTKISQKWPSRHSQSAVSCGQAMLGELGGKGGINSLYANAKSLWPDPINLYYAAMWEGKSNQQEMRLADLNELERLRGKIFKYHFAGLVVLIALEKARCLRKLSSFAESLRMYEWVAKHWSNSHAAETLMSEARMERDELERRLK